MKGQICALLVVSVLVLGFTIPSGNALIEEYPAKPITIICPWGVGGGERIRLRDF